MFYSLLLTVFTLLEWNVENLFDCQHDTLKQDEEFLPDGSHHWTPYRYWQKLNRIGQTIIATGSSEDDYPLPDLVALCEVENDSVLRDLTQRSLLRNARYEYVMTQSPDVRGIDVALLYSPFTFSLIAHHSISIPSLRGMRPTRDILYAAGMTTGGDTLHVFVVHAPSRSGGEQSTRRFRLHVADVLLRAVDSVRNVSTNAKIIITGDFNDYASSPSLKQLAAHQLIDVSSHATGTHGARGTYCYRGLWGSLDHIFVSPAIADSCQSCYVFDAPYLLEPDDKYNSVKPKRCFAGPAYLGGISDHLPLMAVFQL